MPNRVLKDSIKRSAQVDSLTWFEEVVFYRLLVTADDFGCMDGRPLLLKSELFPIKEGVTKKAVEDAINRLTSVGLLQKYEVSGMPYVCFPKWEMHQRIRTKHRKYPAPPEWSEALDSSLQQIAADCGRLPPESESERESESNPNPKENPNARAARTPFRPPTVEEVETYCQERQNGVDASRFVDFYASKGWKVGSSPMKDWRAAVRTWERRQYEGQGRPSQGAPGSARFANLARLYQELGDDE